MNKTLKTMLVGLAGLLPVLLHTGNLYATDLSYPPPGSSTRYVDKRHGEQNRPSHVDRLDARTEQDSHTIIQPGYRPYQSRRLQAPGTSAAHIEPLDRPDNSAGSRTGHPLLWKLDKNGIASSYIMGTIHLDDDRVMELSDTVLARLRSADRLMLELALSQGTTQNILRRMVFTDGRTLQQVIGADLFSDVIDCFAQDVNVPGTMLSVLKPWAAMLILLRPANTSGTFLDKELGQLARNDGIPVIGLETVDEQLSAFDSITLEDQTSLLRSTISNLDGKDAVYKQLLDAYIDGDLAEIVRISEATQPKDVRLAGLYNENLITKRNERMARRMLPYLQQGNSFVAIGALHLPGEQGLLALLEKRGYRLTRLEYGM